MTLDSINMYFEQKRAKSGGYPSAMRYFVKKTDGSFEFCVEDTGKKDDTVWKLADSWGFAAFDYACNALKTRLGLRFAMRTPLETERPKYEALRRRLSYLAAVNRLPIILFTGDKEECLYSMAQLDKRPDDEVIRPDFTERGDNDAPGRLEKDFQVYLFGKGLSDAKKEEGVRTNERLALFGKDFIGISKGVEREFPTGVFDKKVGEENRILPTEFIDLVTINKSDEIAIIELKFSDNPLEVIAQLLNYALFFHSYQGKLAPLVEKHLGLPGGSAKTKKIKAYLVSNVFHQKFDDVWRYYCKGPIAMQQVIMGYYPPANHYS